MLKLYHSRPVPESKGVCAPVAATTQLEVDCMDNTDGLRMDYPICASPPLKNLEMLKSLKSQLDHLSPEQQELF